mmetsp:Transcript_81441/g.176018  ORF Transcript_81441/g.176018 Transcript_81441/m.176018 type:complete len:138 (-) Transcript_81441:8-421(-)
MLLPKILTGIHDVASNEELKNMSAYGLKEKFQPDLESLLVEAINTTSNKMQKVSRDMDAVIEVSQNNLSLLMQRDESINLLQSKTGDLKDTTNATKEQAAALARQKRCQKILMYVGIVFVLGMGVLKVLMIMGIVKL